MNLPRRGRAVPVAFSAFAMIAVIALPLRAASYEPEMPQIVTPRLEGAGGAYAASPEGIDTLSTNPACLPYVEPEWSFGRLAIEVSGPLFDIPSVLRSDDMTTAILDLAAEYNGINMGLNATGPLAFARVEKNFGFGVFNRSVVSVQVPTVTQASVLAGEELLLVGGYGLTVIDKGNHELSVGVQLKGFIQTFMAESGTSVTVLNDLTEMNIDNLPVLLTTGVGADLGVYYRLFDRLSFAIVCRDAYTPVFVTPYQNLDAYLEGDSLSDAEYDTLDPDLTFGAAYTFALPESWTTITGARVMFDYRDALGPFLNEVHRHFALNFALGAELELLDVICLRAGIRDLYLSAGVGLDLTYLRVDLAMYGKELGLDPGDRPLLNIALSLSFEY